MFSRPARLVGRTAALCRTGLCSLQRHRGPDDLIYVEIWMRKVYPSGPGAARIADGGWAQRQLSREDSARSRIRAYSRGRRMFHMARDGGYEHPGCLWSSRAKVPWSIGIVSACSHKLYAHAGTASSAAPAPETSPQRAPTYGLERGLYVKVARICPARRGSGYQVLWLYARGREGGWASVRGIYGDRKGSCCAGKVEDWLALVLRDGV